MKEEGWRSRLEFNRPDPLRWPRSLSLTWRILAVNILPLLILGGGIFYLDSYRKVLLDERYKLARIEAQITAEALAGASRERQPSSFIANPLRSSEVSHRSSCSRPHRASRLRRTRGRRRGTCGAGA